MTNGFAKHACDDPGGDEHPDDEAFELNEKNPPDANPGGFSQRIRAVGSETSFGLLSGQPGCRRTELNQNFFRGPRIPGNAGGASSDVRTHCNKGARCLSKLLQRG